MQLSKVSAIVKLYEKISESLNTDIGVKTTTMENRILYVRLPCNPIFPIGVVYLADHVHKLFPTVEQHIFDLGQYPLDFLCPRCLCRSIPADTAGIFLARYSSYACGGRGGNPLQNAFEFYYARNPLIKLQGAMGGRLAASYYTELWRNQGLIKRG